MPADVLSLSTGGAFVQGLDDVAVGAPVRIEIAVGPPVGLLVCRGTIARQGRRSTGFGCGIAFDPLPRDVREGLERLLASYPGPLTTRGDGLIAWPFGASGSALAGEEAEVALDALRAKDLHSSTPGRVFGVLDEALARVPDARAVRFAIHGCRLVPAAGLTRSTISAGIATRPTEPGASIVLALIAQAQLADALAEWGWELAPPDGEILAMLEGARAFVDRVVAHLDAFEPGPAFAAANRSGLLAELRERMRTLQRFAVCAEHNASAARWLT